LSGTSPDPRRSCARVLDTAEGVVIALRRCGLSEAFMEIAQTAKRQNVAPLSLADALVAIAVKQPTDDLDQNAVRIAYQSWGALLDAHARDQPTTPSIREPNREPNREPPQAFRQASA
jgi:hypothetical protein